MLAALGVASLALAAWEQPRMEVLNGTRTGESCPMPRVARSSASVAPDHDLLLFMFGLSQGMRPQS